MGTKPDKDVEDASSTDLESANEAPIRALPLSPDLFVSARAPRREFLPPSLRAGRPRGKHARGATPRTDHPCFGTPRMYLVERDEETETTRIALRRRFEDVSGSTAATESESQESVAG